MFRLSKNRILLLFALLLIIILMIYFITNNEKEQTNESDDGIEEITANSSNENLQVKDESKDRRNQSPLEEEKLLWQQLIQQYKEILLTNTSLYDLEVVSDPSDMEVIRWYGYEVEGKKIYFSESARDNYIYLIHAIPNIHRELENYFGFSLLLDVPVYIVDQFDDPALMYKGYYVDHKIYLLLNVRKQRDYDIRPLYVHEMAHLYQKQQWNMDQLHSAFGIGERIWITEGMAEYIATQKVTYPDLLTPIGEILPHQLGYQQYKDRFEEIPIEDVRTMKSWPTFWYEHNYIIFESIIYYLETVYGHASFMNWIQRVSDGIPLEQATKEVFAATGTQIIADWKKFFSLP